MAQHVFYSNVREDNILSFGADEAHHAYRVMRLEIGSSILALDGVGAHYVAEIITLSRSAMTAEIKEEKRFERPIPRELYVGMLKNKDRNLMIVEKACELGATGINFVRTHHSEGRVPKIEKLEKRVLAAAKQSRRAYFPLIRIYDSFKDGMDQAFQDTSKCFIAGCKVPVSSYIFNQLDASESMSLFVGPEGGWSDQEIEEFCENGGIPVSLGERRLRAETAAIFALSCVEIKSKASQ